MWAHQRDGPTVNHTSEWESVGDVVTDLASFDPERCATVCLQDTYFEV